MNEAIYCDTRNVQKTDKVPIIYINQDLLNETFV